MYKILGLIPARYSSSRLPGKPLRLIGNKPMIQHTYEAASKSIYLDKLVVLTDDEKIAEVVQKFGGEVSLTPSELSSGTDRCAYFCERNSEFDIIVNIQGDEPFIPREVIDYSIKPLLQIDEIQISTAASCITDFEKISNPAITKVVLDEKGFALYFSRSIIPFYRDSNREKLYLRHIGIYVYRREALLNITKLPQTELEKIEQLEQLRMLGNGYKIKVELVDYDSISVDTEEDLVNANKYWEKISGN